MDPPQSGRILPSLTPSCLRSESKTREGGGVDRKEQRAAFFVNQNVLQATFYYQRRGSPSLS